MSEHEEEVTDRWFLVVVFGFFWLMICGVLAWSCSRQRYSVECMKSGGVWQGEVCVPAKETQ